MTSIRRTALRALVGVAAALLLGFAGVAATTASATHASPQAAAEPSDYVW
jgi:hypothetical protein